jgi:hypothetical protein
MIVCACASGDKRLAAVKAAPVIINLVTLRQGFAKFEQAIRLKHLLSISSGFFIA